MSSAGNYPDGFTQADHDRHFGREPVSDAVIAEKAAALIDGDLVFDAIGNGPDSYDIALINAVWSEDACEVGNIIMNRINEHAKAEAWERVKRGEI